MKYLGNFVAREDCVLTSRKHSVNFHVTRGLLISQPDSGENREKLTFEGHEPRRKASRLRNLSQRFCHRDLRHVVLVRVKVPREVQEEETKKIADIPCAGIYGLPHLRHLPSRGPPPPRVSAKSRAANPLRRFSRKRKLTEGN